MISALLADQYREHALTHKACSILPASFCEGGEVLEHHRLAELEGKLHAFFGKLVRVAEVGAVRVVFPPSLVVSDHGLLLGVEFLDVLFIGPIVDICTFWEFLKFAVGLELVFSP